MIASVSGTVTHVGADSAVLDVGGVGLSVRATPATLSALRREAPATLHTTLVVREDSLTLYGFGSAAERDLFELLQTAGGVGPRLAQAALAVHPPETVRRAISEGDTATLTRIPGVGKKGAERLVLELRDRVGAAPGAGLSDGDVPAPWREQVRQGLTGLGWSVKDADAAVSRLKPQNAEPDVPGLLKQAIRLLGTK